MVKEPLNILLVGNCTQDRVFILPRYPLEDDELRAEDSYHVPGGNACNSAFVLQQLGHQVHLMCALARDDAARGIRKKLKEANIDDHLCQTYPNGATPVSSIWLNQQNASRTIVHHRDLPELSVQHLLQIKGEQYDWIHFEGRNIEALLSVMPDLYEMDIPMSLEIEKYRQGIHQLIPFVSTLIISSHYLKARNISANEVLGEFRAMNPQCNMVCTLGKRGLVALNSDNELITIEAEPAPEPIDTRGAGDCFIAGLVSYLSKQYNFDTALRFANKLAARKVQAMGLKLEDFPV